MPTVGWRKARRIWNRESVEVAAVPRLLSVDSRIFEKNKAADVICDGCDTGKCISNERSG